MSELLDKKFSETSFFLGEKLSHKAEEIEKLIELCYFQEEMLCSLFHAPSMTPSK